MKSTIAVVIGQGGYNDMGLIRSCGEAGMKVILVAPANIVMPLQKSKYVIKWVRNLITTSKQLEALITQLSSEYDSRLTLYPASDLAACLMDEYSVQAPENVVVPNAKGKLRHLMDKDVMGEIARNSNLTVPNSVKLNLKDTENDPPFLPCIIKPLKSIAGDKGDITICRNKNIYQVAVNVYRSKGFFDVLVQEFIEGKNQEEIAITGVSLEDGTILTPGIIHKKRIRGNGSTVFAEFIPGAPSDLQRKIQKFISSCNFTGIFDIEFLKNDDGIFFIECNYRNGAYGYAITDAGFNMPNLFALGTLHKRIEDFEIRKRIFMEERSDLLNVLETNITLAHWIKDIFHTDTFLWWNRKDPKPILSHYTSKVTHKLVKFSD